MSYYEAALMGAEIAELVEEHRRNDAAFWSWYGYARAQVRTSAGWQHLWDEARRRNRESQRERDAVYSAAAEEVLRRASPWYARWF